MKSTMSKTIASCVALASTFAFHQHASAQHFDIELIGSCEGAIEIGNDAPVDAATQYKIFETEFGELGEPYGTDDPGYVSTEALCPLEILWYEGVGSLEYWDGVSWSAMVPDAEQIHLYGALGEDTIYTITGVTGDVFGAIDQADSAGSLHAHVEYEIENLLGGQDPGAGAYLIPVKIYGDNHATIETFYIAFNLGMEEEDFDAAIASRSLSQ